MNFEIKNNVSLKPYNTMAIDAKAQYFVDLNNESQISNLLTHGLLKKPIFILGGGSNILFTQDYAGLVIQNQLKGIEVLEDNFYNATVKVAAGENWHNFVLYCLEKGYGGLENLSLIPGTVGAAPIQNIGAYGVEAKECILAVEAYEISTAEKKTFSNSDCEFAYRDSIFKRKLKNQFLISSVTFKLHKFPKLNFMYGTLQETIQKMSFPKLSIKVVSDAVIQVRQAKLPDPAVLPNTGSFFKNPFIDKTLYKHLLKNFPTIPHYPTAQPEQVKIPAGWLIEQAGLKGQRFGTVGVYEKQALVLVNHGNGQADDIMSMVASIQKTVFEKFQIKLQPEVQLV